MNFVFLVGPVLLLESPLWAKALGVAAVSTFAITADGGRGPHWLYVTGLAAFAVWAAVAGSYWEYGYLLYAFAVIVAFVAVAHIAPWLKRPAQAARRLADRVAEGVARVPARVRLALERVVAVAVVIGMGVGARWATRMFEGGDGALLGSWGVRLMGATQWVFYVSAGLLLCSVVLELVIPTKQDKSGGQDVQG